MLINIANQKLFVKPLFKKVLKGATSYDAIPKKLPGASVLTRHR
jgi:hypothetical protein